MEIREDIRALMDACVSCGSCLKVCPSYKHGGCNPLRTLTEGEGWSGCIRCGKCTDNCRFSDPRKVMMYMNSVFGGIGIQESFEKEGYNLPSGKYTCGVPDYKNSETSLMPGCIVNAQYRFLENAAVEALKSFDIDVKRYEGGCCTHPVSFSGLTDDERHDIKTKMLKGYGNIITLCGGCNTEMISSGANSKHIVDVLFTNIDKIKKSAKCNGLKVAIQPGCHMEHLIGKYKKICLKAGFEVLDIKPGCCGKETVARNGLMKERQESMKEADVIVVGCPACFLWYDNYEGGKPVLHISEVVAIASGYCDTIGCHKIHVPISIADDDSQSQ